MKQSHFRKYHKRERQCLILGKSRAWNGQNMREIVAYARKWATRGEFIQAEIWQGKLRICVRRDYRKFHGDWSNFHLEIGDKIHVNRFGEIFYFR